MFTLSTQLRLDNVKSFATLFTLKCLLTALLAQILALRYVYSDLQRLPATSAAMLHRVSRFSGP